MDFNKQGIEKLQKIENSVGRQIMGAPRYTQESALRGEIGMCSMRARVMEGQIKSLEYCMKDEGNELLRRIAKVIKELRKSKWIKGVLAFRKLTGRRDKMKTEEIKMKVREWDTKEWIKELNEKSSLKLYREWKKDMGGQERVYDNSESAMILFKCRSNNMNLGDSKRFQN